MTENRQVHRTIRNWYRKSVVINAILASCACCPFRVIISQPRAAGAAAAPGATGSAAMMSQAAAFLHSEAMVARQRCEYMRIHAAGSHLGLHDGAMPGMEGNSSAG